MRRFLAALAAAAIAVVSPWASALAGEQPTEVVTIELVGDPGTRFVVNGRPYAGPVTFTERADGIAFTETASIEQYLQGIAEVPFSWPRESLAAQAVAARTYLARNLLGGRSGNEVRYGYDICATNRCQVYRGVQLVEGESGDRWREAVVRTAGEVLLHNGKPIEAVYTANVGSRSSANQDVWASAAIPYLQPVDSPELGIAPFSEWTVEVSGEQFVAILKAAGYDVGGSLVSIVVDDPPEGEGRTTLTVITTEGTDSLLAPRLKRAFNIHGDDLFPGILPARIDNGRLLPEPILSYTYEIAHEHTESTPLDRLLPTFDRLDRDRVVIQGEGWGHGVGMSQWGAKIMADGGATYDEILSHYYTGTAPELAPSVVPEQVVVGLDWGRVAVPITLTGPAKVLVNEVSFGKLGPGEWIIASTPYGIDVFPAGMQMAPTLIAQRHWPR